MLQKPVFWILGVLLAAAGAWIAHKHYQQAVPYLQLEITMDRAAALHEAQLLAKAHGWGPEQARGAAAFQTDHPVKTYVELEAGGAEAFRRMIDEGFHHPYYWEVRLFREREAREVRVRFSPAGTFWSFREKMPEGEAGAALTAEQALAIAELAVVEQWGIDLGAYSWVEGSEILRPGGRVDHTIVFERTGMKAGEARYRLILGVSGDRLTALEHRVQIPEAFERRYESMRSANETLTQTGWIVLLLGYILGGCGFGLFFMLRVKAVIWRPALIVGMLVGILAAMSVLNSSDLAWMGYDTAVSFQQHGMMQALIAFSAWISTTLGTALVLITGETLSRRAFPNHLQFWQLWRPGVVNTRQVLALTLAALLMVFIHHGYSASFFYVAIQHWGWWAPVAEQFNPNLLALHWPWLEALSLGVLPGLTEEALFRAVPIAGAVLLGRRYGRPSLWLAAAFVLQAVVFASVHANYPQQPYYFRLVELILPALSFGLIYYLIGLYPAVLVHAWFNFTLGASVLFTADTPGMLGSQVLVVILGLLPFWVILFGWLRQRSFSTAPAGFCNSDWRTPLSRKKEIDDLSVEQPVIREDGPWVRAPLILVGLLIFCLLVFWFLARPFDKQTDPLNVTRAEAVAAARSALESRGVEIPEDWKVLSHVWKGPWNQHQYVLDVGGNAAYEQLSELHLHGMVWDVKWVTFEGPVEERAEQYRVFVTHEGKVFGLRIFLPESREGVGLEEGQARALAENHARVHYGDRVEELEVISARSTRHPNRTDWTVSYSDPEASVMGKQEARFDVHINGDQVSGWGWYVHVPDEWTREFRERRNTIQMIGIASGIFVALGVMAGAIVGMVRWSSGCMGVRTFVWVASGLSVLNLLGLYFTLPEAFSQQLSTAQPYGTQAGMAAAFGAIGSILSACFTASIMGMIACWRMPKLSDPRPQRLRVWMISCLFALVLAFGMLLLQRDFPSSQAHWGNTGAVASGNPTLSVMLQPVGSFLMATSALFLVMGLVDHLSRGWQRRRLLMVLLLLTVGWVFAGMSAESVSIWAVKGGVLGLMMLGLYVGILRFHMPMLIPMIALFQAIVFAGNTFPGMHPGAATGGTMGLVLLILVAWYWYRALEKQDDQLLPGRLDG